MITTVSNNHRQLEVLVLLLIIARMLTISNLLLVIIKDKVMMAMEDITLLPHSLGMGSPNRILLLGMISSKVITLHLDMIAHPTRHLMVIQVSSLAPNLVTLPSLVMGSPLLPKLVTGPSQLEVTTKVMLRSLLPVSQHMASPNSHRVPKVVITSLLSCQDMLLFSQVMHHRQSLLLVLLSVLLLHQQVTDLHLLSRDMVAHLMEHLLQPNQTMVKRRHHLTVTAILQGVTLSLKLILVMEAEQTIQLNLRELSSKVMLQNPRPRVNRFVIRPEICTIFSWCLTTVLFSWMLV
jgi:hypothetical protein